jgi:hypothetical protein
MIAGAKTPSRDRRCGHQKNPDQAAKAKQGMPRFAAEAPMFLKRWITLAVANRAELNRAVPVPARFPSSKPEAL